MKYTFDVWSCDYDCCYMTRIFIYNDGRIVDEEWGMDNYPIDKEAVKDLLSRNNLLSEGLKSLIESKDFHYIDLEEIEIEV